MIRYNLLLSICAAGAAMAAPLELARPARHWEFMDAVGPRAAVMGTESGTLEAWVFPLKLLRDFRLVFTLDGRTMPAESLVRRVVARPGSFSLVYAGEVAPGLAAGMAGMKSARSIGVGTGGRAVLKAPQLTVKR